MCDWKYCRAESDVTVASRVELCWEHYEKFCKDTSGMPFARWPHRLLFLRNKLSKSSLIPISYITKLKEVDREHEKEQDQALSEDQDHDKHQNEDQSTEDGCEAKRTKGNVRVRSKSGSPCGCPVGGCKGGGGDRVQSSDGCKCDPKRRVTVRRRTARPKHQQS